MTDPVGEISTDFSEPGAEAPPWADVREVLASSEMFWLSTVRGDGSPHVTPLPAVWDDGALHICTGEQEQKAVNLARDPRCVLTTGTPTLHSGLDVVVEGTAVKVTDQARLEHLRDLWKSKLDWDFQVLDGAFTDGDHGRAPVYAVTPVKVLAFGKSPYTQTRYTF